VSLAPDIVAGVSRRLAEHAGLELPAWVVEARTTARLAELQIDPSSYLELIATARGAGELAALVEAVRVGESSLFRHLPQISALVDVVVPSLRAKAKRAVRVWSAGCATGEEPYTLAAVLSRALPGVQLTVIATDVSADALDRARDAAYPADELRDVPEEWRDIFVIDGDTLHVHPDIANLVTFEQANLLDAIPPKSCDLVWCRNVLIYFSADARRRVVERLIASLVPGGYLFVGYSETLRDIERLETIRHGDCVFYAKPEKETTNPGVEAFRTPPYGTPLPPRTAAFAIPLDTGEEREHTAVGVPPPPRPTPVPARPAGKSSPGIALPPTSASKSSPNLPRASKSSPNLPAMPSTSASKSSPNIPISPRATPLPSTIVRVALVGQPSPQQLASLVGERLSAPNIERLVIDLDSAEMLSDDLAPVLRRARAAAAAEDVALDLVATKPGTKRWLSRHNLAEDA
jgi:chemotaxis protein methyltransferase CheR